MKYPVVVPGEGPERCTGMILGEAPGRDEISQGRPFVGASGTLLSETLEFLGVSRDDFYITNAFRGDVGWGNPNPTSEQVSDHTELLWKDVQERGIKFILALGNVASGAVAPLDYQLPFKITRDHGQWYRSWLGVEFIPAYHPSYVLRGRKTREPVFAVDVRRFVRRCQDVEGDE